jgi:hypothetical protein
MPPSDDNDGRNVRGERCHRHAAVADDFGSVHDPGDAVPGTVCEHDDTPQPGDRTRRTNWTPAGQGSICSPKSS